MLKCAIIGFVLSIIYTCLKYIQTLEINECEGICQKYVPTIEKKGLAAVSSSFFAALYSAFGRYDVVHIHAEGPAFGFKIRQTE